MVIYLDVVFLTNFVLDFAMLAVTAKIRGMKPSYRRIGLSAAVGASYVLFMFVPELSVLYTFVIKCLFSVVMIMTAFGYKSFTGFVGTLAAFYAVNATAAGAVFGLHFMFQSTHEVWNGILFTQTGGIQYAFGLSLWFIALASAAGVYLFRNVHASAKRKEKRTEYLAEIAVQIGGDTYKCTGLIDTGNQLYDPLTRTPVMVMEAAVWKQVLPESWVKAIRSNEADKIVFLLGEEKEAFPYRDRIRLVPYRGINGGRRFMLAVKPDKVTILHGGRKSEADNVLIGIDGGTLCADGVYKAIIHPALIS